MAKWTLEDRTLTISGVGEMKDWKSNSEEDWHNTQYTIAIEKVIIENGVTNIGDYAFNECSSLESTTIPEGVISIGYDAFSGCSSLTNIDIPSSVTSIGVWAFSGCSSLESIEIPEGVTNIESGAISKATIIYTKLNSEGHRYAEEGKQGYILIFEKGDINQDGKVDVTDFLMLKRHLVAGNRTEWKLTGNALLSADMNENGKVDITDLFMLKKVIVEKM